MAELKAGRESDLSTKIVGIIQAAGGQILWNDVIPKLDRNEVTALTNTLAYAKENGTFYRTLIPRKDANGKMQMDLYLTTTKPSASKVTIP